MGIFSLLSVLGRGGEEVAAHPRFPYVAFQAGSVLVLWDYTKTGSGSRRFLPLRPGRRCFALYFSADARHLLALWLSAARQPVFAAWRVDDGAKVVETRLTDQPCGPDCRADFNADSSQLLLVQGSAAPATGTVLRWAAAELQPRYVSHGHLGITPEDGARGSPGILAARLLDDGCHFCTVEAEALRVWAFTEQRPRLVLSVQLKRPIWTAHACGGSIYLLPRQGRLRVMSLDGELMEPSASVPADSNQTFTALAVHGATLCLGSSDGSIFAYRVPRLELYRRVPPAGSAAVVGLALGMNDEYAFVSFGDGSFGVCHLESAAYVAMRLSHALSVRTIALAPPLQVPPELAQRSLGTERLRLALAMAFVSIAEGESFISWPRSGAPARGSTTWCPTLGNGSTPAQICDGEGRSLALESFPPPFGARVPDRSVRTAATCAVFSPIAKLVAGSSGIAPMYQLLVGASDGSLHAMESGIVEAAAAGQSADPTAVSQDSETAWRTLRLRPLATEASPHESMDRLSRMLARQSGEDERLAIVPGMAAATPAVVCRHLIFSPCGRFVLAGFCSGYVELLHFPLLERAAIIEPAVAANAGEFHAAGRALFVWRPRTEDRLYDRNLYVLSLSSANIPRLLLYEVYLLGGTFAKSTLREFSTAALTGAGNISDFCVHPSQRFLVASATHCAESPCACLLIFDLWEGQLLQRCPVFDSPLLAPLTPLRCLVRCDAAGAHIFCAARSLALGPPDATLRPGQGQSAPGAGPPGDDLLARGPRSLGEPEPSSVLCVVDFMSGRQVYQSRLDFSCLELGAAAHDPSQLFVGSSDGTVSLWRMPEPVAARVRAVLDSAARAAGATRSGDEYEDVGANLERAVAQYWADVLAPNGLAWERVVGAAAPDLGAAWPSAPRPDLVAPAGSCWRTSSAMVPSGAGGIWGRCGEDAMSAAWAADDDVVVRARRGGGHTWPTMRAPAPEVEKLGPLSGPPVACPAALPSPALNAPPLAEPMRDPISGLEEPSLLGTSELMMVRAQTLGASPSTPLPRWLEDAEAAEPVAKMATGTAARSSVFEDIEQFELMNSADADSESTASDAEIRDTLAFAGDGFELAG